MAILYVITILCQLDHAHSKIWSAHFVVLTYQISRINDAPPNEHLTVVMNM